MHFYKEEYFRGLVDNIPLYEQQRTFSAPESTMFDIFLSYNINDKDIVRGIYHALTRKGYKVYLDFIIDRDLDRKSVNRNTASRIRNRLLNSKTLIYAQSPSAAISRWMPWELGMIDGNTRKCYVLPVMKAYEFNFTRQEYLMLYPLIACDDNGCLTVYEYENSLYGRSFSVD